MSKQAIIQDIWKMVERAATALPFPTICRHRVALDLLELLESHGEIIPPELCKAVCDADDAKCAELFDFYRE